MREYKEIYNYEQYKKHSQVTKGNSRDEQEAWKDRAPDWLTTDPRRYRSITQINKKYTTVQALRSGHANSRLSKATQRVAR